MRGALERQDRVVNAIIDAANAPLIATCMVGPSRVCAAPTRPRTHVPAL